MDEFKNKLQFIIIRDWDDITPDLCEDDECKHFIEATGMLLNENDKEKRDPIKHMLDGKIVKDGNIIIWVLNPAKFFQDPVYDYFGMTKNEITNPHFPFVQFPTNGEYYLIDILAKRFISSDEPTNEEYNILYYPNPEDIKKIQDPVVRDKIMEYVSKMD